MGAGVQVTQTAGLALASDLATPASRPRVVALMYVMFLLGMVFSSLLFGFLLKDFSPVRLIQVVQGAAALTMLFNLLALWKQEARQPKTKEQLAMEPIIRELQRYCSWLKCNQRPKWALASYSVSKEIVGRPRSLAKRSVLRLALPRTKNGILLSSF